MEQTIRPMDLGDIFNKSFQLIGRTAGRTFMIGMVALVPVSVLYGWVLQRTFSNLGQMLKDLTLLQGQEPTPDQMMKIMGPILTNLPLMSLLGIVFMLGGIVAMIAAISVISAEMVGEELTWKQALSEAVRGKVWRGLGLQLLQQLVYVGIAIACYIPFVVLMVGAVMGSGESGNPALAILAFLLFMFGIIGAIGYFAVRWLYSMQAIAWEDAGVMEAFKRSWELVKGRWWKTALRYVVLAVVATFALSLITTPIQIFSMWGFFEAIMDMQSSMGDRPDPSIFFDMMSHLGTGIILVIVVSSVLGLMVHPHYVTVMYFDARARNGEFDEDQGDYVNYVE